jgi:hypothetical protein
MRHLVCEVFRLGQTGFHWNYRCVREDDSIDEAMSSTLLALIEISWLDHGKLAELVRIAEAGRYVSPNPNLPDWGYNDINIWLSEPMATSESVCVTNENTQYDSEAATKQRFTYREFWYALECWQEFTAIVASKGKEALVGKPVKFPFHVPQASA